MPWKYTRTNPEKHRSERFIFSLGFFSIIQYAFLNTYLRNSTEDLPWFLKALVGSRTFTHTYFLLAKLIEFHHFLRK